MGKKIDLTISVDQSLKKESERIFESLGLDLETAITIFLKKCEERDGLPFKIERENPGLKTLQAMFEAEELEAKSQALVQNDQTDVKEAPKNKKIYCTHHFQRDYNNILKEGLDRALLDKVIQKLSQGEKLDETYQDHELRNDWKEHRECLILPDWYLVYKITNTSLILTLTRPGYHEDLFGDEDRAN